MFLNPPTKPINHRPCEPCLKGKMRIVINRQSQERTTHPLALIHSDLAGPFPRSHGGALYFIVYIDDYSQMTWLYTLKDKSSSTISNIFIRFKHEVEVSSNTKIQRFRCDNGTGEYMNSAFVTILSDNGIQLEPSAPYTQHQNGVAEAKIRVIQHRTKSMLAHAQAPHVFWAEAATTAATSTNLSPTSSLANMTPFQAWTGRVPSVAHLRVWGCVAYSHMAKPIRRKLHDNSNQCMFIGYVAHTDKLWKLWDQKAQRAFHSSNVVFDEDRFIYPLQGPQVEERPPPPAPASPSQTHNPLTSTVLSPPCYEPSSSNSPDEILHDSTIQDDTILDTIIVKPASETHSLIAVAATFPHDSPIPSTYKEVLCSSEKDYWLEAMREEYQSLMEMNTWSLTERTTAVEERREIIQSRWVFSRKELSDGKIRYKARVVVKGFQQMPGVDFQDTFAPVGRLDTFRVLVALAAYYHWEIQQLDVVTAFLNGELPAEERIYMEQPDGFTDNQDPTEVTYSKPQNNSRVCRLNRALYGLKQAPRVWHANINSFLLQNYFRHSNQDSNLYY